MNKDVIRKVIKIQKINDKLWTDTYKETEGIDINKMNWKELIELQNDKLTILNTIENIRKHIEKLEEDLNIKETEEKEDDQIAI